ncbi:uncharacterized protein LOC130589451 [Beta vulgaris subsp. vulgaris]|uniref:uncharacterized protein LOC130589451 n=1 Tax=Beta vulgaris subsp. vulgaris TaxID=3555 RepID=UPI002548BAFC|nr:uncharacterized protein LOC130589451 [Beta vulgaris subsp. vulgaris]
MEIKSLPQDPGKRKNMSDFHNDDRDYIRRFYIDRGLCQPKDNEGSDAFVSEGFRTWSKPDALNKHIGGHMSVHNKAMTSLVDFKNQKDSLPSAFSNQSQEMASNYRKRLEASVKCVKNGGLNERFLGLVHVPNTTSLTLKEAIESLLMEHSLSLSRVRGQGYDGASNMRGEIAGLKTLITDECPQAYYVHCFAHQLQLTLVAVAKKNSDCSWLFLDVLPLLLNFVGESGTGLNQEKSLSRPGDTRWGSHFKTIVNVLDLYRPILESLDAIAESSIEKANKNKACAIINLLMTFDFVFVAYLMTSIFGITHELNLALQKSVQDIVNAMTLVDVTKRNLQKLRDGGWDAHMTKVSSFLTKHDIEILNMEGMYVAPGRRCFVVILHK